METRKWNTVKEVLVKGGGTMEVGSYEITTKSDGWFTTTTLEQHLKTKEITTCTYKCFCFQIDY